jgi:WD40 repeat protein
MSDEFDPYYAWLGIPPKDQPPNHYRLLGVELFEANLDVIESAAFRQMGHVRTYQSGQHSRESQRLLNELSAAKINLLDPDKKQAYDQLLRATIESITAFLPDEPPDAAMPTPGAESSVHVIDFELDASSSGSAVRSASVSAIRRTRPRPASRLPIVIGVIVAVVCLGLAVIFGNKILQREQKVVLQPSTLDRSVPNPSTTPIHEDGVAQPDTSPTPVRPELPTSSENTSGVATTSTNENAATPAKPQPVTAWNDATRNFPRLSAQVQQARMRSPVFPALRVKLEATAGIADNEFVITQSMPYDEFLSNENLLRSLAYRPLRIRPYVVNGESRVASAWVRDAIDWRMALGVDANTLTQADQTLKSQGFYPADVACWQTDETKFAAVWILDENQATEHELMLGVTGKDFPVAAARARASGLMPLSHHVCYNAQGDRLYSVVWHKPEKVMPWHHWDDDRDAHESALKRPGAPQDVCLAYQPDGALMYGGLLVGLPDPNALELHGYDTEDHRTQCRDLASKGCRPIAIAAAASLNGSQIVTASVWQSGGAVAVGSGLPTAGMSAPNIATASPAAATHALRFDGNAFVTVTNTSDLATRRNTFTAEMWFRCTEPSIKEGYVLMGTTAHRDPPVGSDISTASGWHVTAGRTQGETETHETALRYASGAGSIRGSGAEVPALGSGWHHLAVCNSPADGNYQLEVFLDGTRTQSNRRSLDDAVFSTTDFFLGKSVYLPDRHAFIGDIKAFRLSSEVRYRDRFTPPQVFAGDSTTLTLLNFAGAPSNYAADISGNLRHGIITGAKWVVADAPPSSSMAATPESPPVTAAEPPATTLSEARLPVPSGEDRKAGSSKVRDIFATDFQAAKDKPAMIALAKDLLKRGREEQDTAAKFALLYESRELMLEAADLKMAMETTDELCAWFEVDLWTLKCDTLTKLATTTRPDVERRPIAMMSLELTDEAIGNSDWTSSEKLLAAAARANARLKDREIVRIVGLKRKQVQTSKKLWEDAEQAASLLATSPDDPAANLKLGRYRCFVTSEWEVGVLHLAKGSDAQLAKLAELEIKNPQGADSLALANQWYEWGEKAAESDKNGALLRARHWYTTALPNLTGLDRTVAEKKLEELTGKVEDTATTSKQLAWLSGPVGELKRLEGHTAEVTSLDVSNSGTMLVSGSTDGTVRFWDLADGKETGQVNSSVNRIVKVALFRDDQFVFVAGSRNLAEVWNARTGKPATSMTIPSSISSAGLSGDDKILVCSRRASSNGNISLYNMGTGAAVGQLNCPLYPAAVTLSRTGRLVAAASADNNLYVWNIASGQLAAPFAGLGSNPNDVVISPNEQLVAACASSQVMIWELATGKMLSRTSVSSYASQLAFAPDSRRILCAGMMHEVSVINVEDGKLIQTLTGQARGGISTAKAISYLPDPRGAVSAGYDGVIRVWRLPD